MRFVTCNESVDAFIFLNSKLLIAKSSLFVFGATYAELHWQFVSICSCFIRDQFLSVVMLEWIVRETENLLIASAVGCRFESYT